MMGKLENVPNLVKSFQSLILKTVTLVAILKIRITSFDIDIVISSKLNQNILIFKSC